MGPRVTAEAQRLLDSLASPAASWIYNQATTYADGNTGRIGLGLWLNPGPGLDERCARAAGQLLDAGLIRLEVNPHDPMLQNAWVVHLEPKSLIQQAYQFGELAGCIFELSPKGDCGNSGAMALRLAVKPAKLVTEARRSLLRSLIWPDILHGGMLP